MEVSNPSKADPRQHLLALDLVRGLAAFVVLLVHTRDAVWVEFGALPAHQQSWIVAFVFGITRLGQEAVMVFFVLSGFLVGGSVLEGISTGTFNVIAYAIDRLTRILVPLVPACLFTAAINEFAFHQAVSPFQLLANIFGLNGIFVDTLVNNAPLWSLSYEIWFYVLTGAVGYLFLNRANVFAFLLSGASILIFAKLSAAYLLFWFLGAATTYLLGASPRRLLCLGIPIAVIGATIFELGFASKSFHNIVLLDPMMAEGLLCFGFCLCIPFLCQSTVNNVLSPARYLITSISGFSYSLYLFHYPVNSFLNSFFPRSDAITPISIVYMFARLAICIVVSTAAYFCFERHTPKIRRFLRGRIYLYAQKHRGLRRKVASLIQ